MSDDYAAANNWPAKIPPIGTGEAQRVARELLRRFGKAADAPPSASRRRVRYWFGHAPRKCWVCLSGDPGTLRRGWRRLIHDISHIVYEYRYPKLDRHRSHSPIHARLEAEMVAFVLERGWLDGRYRPVVKPKPTPAAMRTTRLAALERRLVNWERKLARADRAARKLRRQIKALNRRLSAG